MLQVVTKTNVIFSGILRKEVPTVHKYDVVLNYTLFLLWGTEMEEAEVQTKSYHSN